MAWIHLQLVLFGICFGAVVGSAVAVMPWAKWGAAIGGGLWGLFFAVSAWSSKATLPPFPAGWQRAVTGLMGLSTGAIRGAFIGLAVVAFVGAGAATALGVVAFAGLCTGPGVRVDDMPPPQRGEATPVGVPL